MSEYTHEQFVDYGYQAWQSRRKDGVALVDADLTKTQGSWFEYTTWFSRFVAFGIYNATPLYEFCWQAWLAASPCEPNPKLKTAFNLWWFTTGQ